MGAAKKLDLLPPEHGLFHLDPPVLSDPVDDETPREILHGGMWPSQRQWWDLTNPIRLFVGGYGSGKTFQLAKRMLHVSLVNGSEMYRNSKRNREWWKDYVPRGVAVPSAIVSPTYAMARETVLLTLEQLATGMEQWCRYWSRPNSGVEPRAFGYQVKKTAPYEVKVYYKRGSRPPRMGRILIYSGENPEKLKGPNLGCAGIDEPFIQDLEVFEQMNVRCRHPKARIREVNLTGTPEQLNWGYDLAEGDLADKYDVGIVQASTLENQALSRGYVNRLLAALDPKVAQAYIHGLFVNLSTGLVYYAFDRSENVVELPMPEHAELGVGMDFNVNPMAATVFWVVKSGADRHIHYFDEIELPNSDTLSMVGTLNDLYGREGLVRPHCAERADDFVRIHRPLRDAYPDSNVGRSTVAPAGRTDYDYIQEGGMVVHRSASGNPPLRDRFNSVNGMLRPRDGRIRCTVSPRCKKLIKYQMLYSHELMNQENQKAMSHLLDARDYALYRLFPADRERLKLRSLKGA